MEYQSIEDKSFTTGYMLIFFLQLFYTETGRLATGTVFPGLVCAPYLLAVLLARCECRPQVNGELSDVHKAVLVAGGRVYCQELHQRVQHEGKGRKTGRTGELTATNKCLVHFLYRKHNQDQTTASISVCVKFFTRHLATE